MTTLTAESTPAAVARPRTARWLLRLHRPALYVWAGLVIALAAASLALWGPLADGAEQGWRQYNACAFTTPTCSYDQDAILLYKDLYNYSTLGVVALPLLVGAWAGGSLVGREMENGTARLTWAQAVSPARWLATKLAVPAAAIAAGTGLLFVLHRKAWTAGRGRIDTAKNWHDVWTFHANGPTTVALALCALAAGALAGLLLRRTLPALALGVVSTAVLWGIAQWAMPYLWPADTRVNPLTEGYPGGGIEVDSGLVTSSGAHIADPGCGPLQVDGCPEVYERLDATGFYTTYHPVSHYWPLQLTTTALVLAMTGLLVTAAFLVLRRATGTARIDKTVTDTAAGPARIHTEVSA
ncbi:ABC transporter permease [Streptomyces sp. NPDC048751]|uniref:ABC transporter permease n=1 Tax=Streptomyces sp. NPDC048751 TaxID=3365591 RepID=UPI0037135D5B